MVTIALFSCENSVNTKILNNAKQRSHNSSFYYDNIDNTKIIENIDNCVTSTTFISSHYFVTIVFQNSVVTK